ncbi:uncharacterized protein MONOS_13390 [Monocercomonoides exilis]|uniref:uncharacterized protein n=1 Tax=Monocercomonoides exilis TaxID=2049356 RepID=UPI00355AA72A|nr:hypothetical protein MONOS_13390 [Monocercomonoides exilis]|eukprot:MONOS_13390.1-p1 / transcript=MONOS_13390.1 / gene=MONOS_13390 / organism=Monocercomonoides_exilis_PA203 / gene_product=unspecified product / transcript_product=unspecified product / location=Mono_scaffold00820:21908-23369(+) / protein_length=364 / sequence_SO=supercontig / SO=protein_coding / is_pseudo=false
MGCFGEMQGMNACQKFGELLSELENCDEDVQKQKVEEMIGAMDEMDREELNSVLTKELFNKINKMMEEGKISIGNSILLLKSVGYCKVLKYLYNTRFDESLLHERFEKMINDENEKKKEEKDEKLLADLCECFLLLHENISRELASMCLPCLLKAASKKEEDEETQKEVEIALLSLSTIRYYRFDKELYLDEIKEIIEYHQEHHNLTRLAYQSAWQFLIRRILFTRSLEEVVMNELHFAREARRELEKLSKCVDGKRKEGDGGKEIIIRRWIDVIDRHLTRYTLWNEELAGVIGSLVQLSRASRDNHPDTSKQCFFIFRRVAERVIVKIDSLLKSGVVGVVLEEMEQSTLNDGIMRDYYLVYF